MLLAASAAAGGLLTALPAEQPIPPPLDVTAAAAETNRVPLDLLEVLVALLAVLLVGAFGLLDGLFLGGVVLRLRIKLRRLSAFSPIGMKRAAQTR